MSICKRLILLALLPGVVGTSVATTSSSLDILRTAWGEPATSHASFLPIGRHFSGSEMANNRNWLGAVTISGFVGGTFINSFNRRIYFGGVERQVYTKNKLSISYIIAIMSGYKGEGLEDLGPLIGHDPGPLVAIIARWLVTNNLSLDLATYGAGGLVGGSYFF